MSKHSSGKQSGYNPLPKASSNIEIKTEIGKSSLSNTIQKIQQLTQDKTNLKKIEEIKHYGDPSFTELSSIEKLNEVPLPDHLIKEGNNIQVKEKHGNFEEEKLVESEISKKRNTTYSNAFGSLENLITFFKNRDFEITNFAKNFQEIEISQDVDRLNHEIVPRVVDAIRNESIKQNITPDGIISLFEKSYISLLQLYGDILKVYSLQSFVYENLPSICYNYGRMSHVLEECSSSREERRSRGCPL